MKSVKSLFAILAIATLSFGCASVTESPVAQAPDQPETISTPADEAIWSGGNEPKPIVTKPIL